LKKIPQIKNGLVEIDFLAKRYNLNPIDLIAPNLGNPFLRLAYMSKIAEAGANFENEQYEKAQQKAERESKINRR
jgi:hypothetical protein